MDWKSNLRRVQSLRSVPSSCDKPTWTEAGLRDKITSVSQLVARYQTQVEVSASIQETSVNDGKTKSKQELKETTPSLLESSETHLGSLLWRNEERDRARAKTGLTRSKSMGSLENSAGSIEALKALFESKAATQIKAKSSFRGVTSPNKEADSTPLMNGEAEEVKSAAEEPKTQTLGDAPVNDAKTEAKEDHMTGKVVNQTRTEKRKKIGGIDFEKIAGSQADDAVVQHKNLPKLASKQSETPTFTLPHIPDEKRRSVADFRGSSLFQTKEKLCVSVKAMSALYLSKVAPQQSTHSPLKPAQDWSSESGKTVKLTKMAEDSQQSKDDLLPPPSARHQPGQGDISGACFQQSLPFQLSKEKLHQQRQKCELRRLLKHTHPELKMLDEVVDEELAEVLSSETGVTAGETGYEGEVLSRRLLFESCALSNKVSSKYTPKMHMAAGTVESSNVSKTSAVLKEDEERPYDESVKEIVEDEKMLGSSTEAGGECEEEMVRIDVQATRRIFESHSVNTSTLNPDSKYQRNVSISGDETEGIQKQKQEFEMCSKENLHSENKNNAPTKSLNFTDQPLTQEPCFHIIGQSTDYVSAGQEEVSPSETAFEDETTDLSDPEDLGEIIKTSTALFQNNPFIPTNIEREHSFENTTKSQSPVGDSGAAQDCLIANVKNRAHLFESMPFDKIRHQNREEIETMVENIKETLNSLYHANAIHSGGSIIEVNETMIAKKATFTLLEGGPQIKYNEVAEGGAQNFIHQLLPRANRKPQITYLKEGSKGSMEATVVNVPVHQHQFTANQDTEFKTANVVQLVEDILNQDNSLRKGVIIQEDVDRCAEIIVYSLYNYFDEKDVKSYCPPQGVEYDDPESDRGDVSKTDIKHNIKSTISCRGAIRPEIPVTGNVKLFKSCIEKGDLEHLKTLQAEPAEQEQELLLNQNVAQQNMELRHEQRGDQTEENTDWVPVDVKKLKNMFSGDDRPAYPKLNVCENIAQSTNMSSAHGRVKNTFTVCGGQPQEETGNSTVAPQASHIHPETQDDGGVHQAELVTVVDDSDEISNLQTAIQSLQQATMGAKSLYHSSQQTVPVQKSSKEPIVIGTAGNVKHSRTEAELPQRHEDHKEDACPWDELPSASNIASELKSDGQHDNTETCHKGSEHSSETAAQQEDEEVVFEGKLQAALDSLGRSNINVTRGDFRAAMIYRNSSKPHKESLQHVDAMSVQKPTKETFCLVTEPKSTQAPLRQDTSKEQVTAANTEHPSQTEILNKVKSVVSEQNRRPVGPKPAIPPKPEHLKVKQIDIQSANTKNPEATQTNTVRPKESDPQPLLIDKQDHHKINTGANSEADSVDLQKNRHFDEAILMRQEIEVRPQVQGSVTPLENDNTDKNISNTQQEQNMNQTDESHVDFHEACKKFGGKKVMSVKNAPVKPKRVKMSQLDDRNPKHMSGDNTFSILARVAEEPSNQTPSCNNPKTCGQNADGKDEHEKEMKLETRVEMRQKKGRTETEDERRQRLSVHMDEIMRGNITAAMNIFDNLRKQEELQSILSRVEEIEKDTSEVDVKSLRGVFENVPDWVVSSDKKKQKKVKVENKGERKPFTTESSDTKFSMAHVFGDLERASEVIMNLKEQTLTRLMDIEEAIKKALYSVSTLKSDSDIAGLSCLFKESLGSVQGSPSSGNISKISIGSSKTKSLQTQESPAALPASQGASLEVASAKQRASPPSSPAFISIQSAARKTDKTEAPPPETTVCPTCQHSSKGEEKYRTTKTLTCNSPAQNGKSDPTKQSAYNQLNPKRGLSVLEVQTDQEGNSIIGTKTVTENYERTDNFGNQFYSSKTSTVFSAQPETTTSTGQAVVGPTAYQVTKYPEVRLPINQKP